MIEAARREAASRHLAVVFDTRVAHEVTPEALGLFDYVFTTPLFYQGVPTRALRIRSLKALASVLKPHGLLLMPAEWAGPQYWPGLRAEFVYAIRRLCRVVCGPRFQTEPGDQFVPRPIPPNDPRTPIYCHVFRTRQELEREFHEAGLTGEPLREGIPWVLRPRTGETPRAWLAWLADGHRTPPPSLNWDDVLREADAQRLTGVVGARLVQAGAFEAIPNATRVRLQEGLAHLAAGSLARLVALKHVVSRCRDQRLTCIPLRGPALSLRLYGDATLRPSGDLDVLVRKAELPELRRLLEDEGFRFVDRRPGFAEAFCSTLEGYRTKPFHLVVEPHWSLAYPPFHERLEMEAVFARCVPGSLEDQPALSLSDSDLLLHLCLHLIHRGGSAPLLWAYDVDRLIRAMPQPGAWERFITTSCEAGVGVLVASALGKVRSAFATPLPEGLLQRLRCEPSGAQSRVTRLVTALALDGRESLALCLTLRDWRRRWRFLAGLLVPSADFMRVHYGLTSRTQLWLAYPRRAWELLRTAATALLRARR